MTVSDKNEVIPDGKYTYVGVDIDTTGRRILDEVNDGREAHGFCESEKSCTVIRPFSFHPVNNVVKLVSFVRFSIRLAAFFFFNFPNRVRTHRLSIWRRTLRTMNMISTLFR